MITDKSLSSRARYLPLVNPHKTLLQNWKNATEPQSHRATEPQRLKRSLRTKQSRFAFRETERARRGGLVICSPLAASDTEEKRVHPASFATCNAARGSQTHSVSSSHSVARPNSKATLQPSWHERTSPRTLVFLCDSVPLWPVFPVPILWGIRQYPSPFVSISPSADRPIFAVWAMDHVATRIASNF